MEKGQATQQQGQAAQPLHLPTSPGAVGAAGHLPVGQGYQGDQGDEQGRDLGIELVGVVKKRPGKGGDCGGHQGGPGFGAQARQIEKEQGDAEAGQQRHEQGRGQARVFPVLQPPPVGRHQGGGQPDGVHRVDLALGGGRRFVNREFGDVELVGISGFQVVGQIHVAVVEQALGDAQVVALVAVEHGDLAEVEGVEEIERQAQG